MWVEVGPRRARGRGRRLRDTLWEHVVHGYDYMRAYRHTQHTHTHANAYVDDRIHIKANPSTQEGN